MATPKTWESEYNGKRYNFEKPLKVFCEIDTGWTANINAWERTMYPPNITGFASRTVSSVTFNWVNGDAPATNNMVSYYETYWTWLDSSDGTEHTGGTIEITNASSSNEYTRECGGEQIETGTPITLYAKVYPLPDQYYENHLLLPSFVTGKTILTLTRLPQVTDITFSDITPSSFKVSWTAILHAIGYEVHLYTGDTMISSTTTNATTLSYTGLVHDTTYKIGIITNADGVEFANSLESELSEVTLLSLYQLQPPTNILLVDRTESSLTFTFDPPQSVEGLTGYTVMCNDVLYQVDKDNRVVTVTGLTENVEYLVGFQSNGDQLNYGDSIMITVPATPMREKLTYYDANTNSDSWVDDEHVYQIKPAVNVTPANVYTTVLSGWTGNVSDWGELTALTPAIITINSRTDTTISVSFQTPETDWNGRYIVGINEGRIYSSPTTTTQAKSNTTKTFSGLSAGTVYTISVKQEVTSGNYFALEPSIYTLRTMSQASAVTNLRMIAATVTSVTFAWDVGEFGVGYNVYFKRQKNVVPTTASTFTKVSLNYNTTEYTITGLTGSTQTVQSVYYIGVVTVGDGVNFTNSNIVTQSGATQQMLKLSGHTVSDTHTARTVRVRWTAPTYGGTPKQYLLKFGEGGLINYDYVANNVFTYTITGLTPQTTYKYGIVAVGDNIYNISSDVVSSSTSTNALTKLGTPSVWCSQQKSRQLTFSWSTVSHADGYLIESGTSSSSFSQIGTVTTTSYQIAGLQPTTTYYFRVRAIANSTSEYSNGDPATANGTTLSLEQLQPPRNITIIGMTPTSIQFSYDAPTSTNGLSAYTFYVNNTYYTWNRSADTRTVTFSGLTPDTQYTFGFQSMGDQVIADDSNVVSVVATPLSERLVVSSNKFPNSDTWSSNEYEYSIVPAVNTTTGTVYTTLFTGWTANTDSYVNKTALTQVAITISNVDYNSVRVNYSTVENGWTGNYLIQVSSGKTFSNGSLVTSITVSNSSTNTTISNLNEGELYTIRIKQVISQSDTSNYFVMGEGSEFTFRTKQHVGQVTNLTSSTVDVTALTFTWDPGQYALSYDLYFNSGTTVNTSQSPTNTTDLYKQYTNLTGQTNYSIGIISKGDGINFGDSTGMTKYTVKTADCVKITGLTISFSNVGQTQMTVNWTIPSSVGSGCTGFQIFVSRSNTKPDTPYTSVTSDARNAIITGLTADRMYNAWVVAVGNNIYYTNSDPIMGSQGTLQLAQLPTPQITAFRYVTKTSMEVDWDLVWVTVNGNQTQYASNYKIFYGTNFSQSVTVSGSRGYYDFTGLTPATTYSYRIQALGNGTTTKDSTTSITYSQQTTSLDTLVITNLAATNITTTSMTISWGVEPDNASNITFCTGNTCANIGATTRSRTITGLMPNTPYTFSVKALGVNGQTLDSDVSTITQSTNAMATLTITNLTVTEICATTASISWSVIGTPVKNFDIYYKKSSASAWTTKTMGQSSAVTTCSFSGLQPNTAYTFRVVANGVNNISTSDEKTVNGTTSSLINLGITDLAQSASTKTSVTFKWDYTPSDAQGVYYEIYSGNTSNPTTKIESSLAGSTKQYTINNLTSGKTYYVKVAVKSTNANYNPVTSSTLEVKTNYVDTNRTTYTLTAFTATYSQIPASGTGTNYVTPTNVSARSTTAYTVCNYSGGVVTADGFESGATVTNLTYSGTASNTGIDLNTNNGGVKVDSRSGNTGNEITAYTVYGVYNGTPSNKPVYVKQEENRMTGYTYGQPNGATFTLKTIPASSYTITIGKTSLNTIYLNNATNVTQTRTSHYTSGYESPDSTYKPGSYNVTVGSNDTLSLSSLGTTIVGETTIPINVWYKANDMSSTTTVYLTRVANEITGYTFSSISPSTTSSNRQTVNPWAVEVEIIPTGVRKFTSKETASTEISDYSFSWDTRGNSSRRNYSYTTSGNKFVVQFGTMGTNMNQNSASTTVIITLNGSSKTVYFRELQNIETSKVLSVNWDVGAAISYNGGTTKVAIDSATYTVTYSSTASSVNSSVSESALLGNMSLTNTSVFSWNYNGYSEYGTVSAVTNPSQGSRSTTLTTEYGGASASTTVSQSGRPANVTQYGSMSWLNTSFIDSYYDEDNERLRVNFNDAGVNMNFTGTVYTGYKYNLRFEVLQNNAVIGQITKGYYTISSSSEERRYSSQEEFIFHITDTFNPNTTTTLRANVEAAELGITFSINPISTNISVT